MVCRVVCCGASEGSERQPSESVTRCRAEALSLSKDNLRTQLGMDSVEVVGRREGCSKCPD